MKFTMEISCDNDAFVSDDGSMWVRNLELSEILLKVASALEAGRMDGAALKDSNGNKVGSFGFDEES